MRITLEGTDIWDPRGRRRKRRRRRRSAAVERRDDVGYFISPIVSAEEWV